MITKEDLLRMGAGYIRVDGVGRPPYARLESVWFPRQDNMLDKLTQGERMLLLAGFSIYRRDIACGLVVILVDDPNKKYWHHFLASSEGSPPDYIDEELRNP